MVLPRMRNGSLRNSPVLSGTLVAVCLAMMGVLFPGEGSAQQKNPLREWISSQGKKVKASLVSLEGTTVRLRLESGRELTLQTNQLSKADQEYLKTEAGESSGSKSILKTSRIELPVKVEGKDYEFKTEHYVFVSESKTNKAFISEAAEVF